MTVTFNKTNCDLRKPEFLQVRHLRPLTVRVRDCQPLSAECRCDVHLDVVSSPLSPPSTFAEIIKCCYYCLCWKIVLRCVTGRCEIWTCAAILWPFLECMADTQWIQKQLSKSRVPTIIQIFELHYSKNRLKVKNLFHFKIPSSHIVELNIFLDSVPGTPRHPDKFILCRNSSLSHV